MALKAAFGVIGLPDIWAGPSAAAVANADAAPVRACKCTLRAERAEERERERQQG